MGYILLQMFFLAIVFAIWVVSPNQWTASCLGFVTAMAFAAVINHITKLSR